ncbi:Slc25a38 [Scenedesmus sp. PABB004]|nr:Slc25a38 [Scenedesmus sp. PABB004]
MGRREQQQEQPPPPPERKPPPALASAVSGALSGAAISACVQPLDVLRTRMQADAALGTSRGVAATLRVVLSEAGVRGLWRGTGPTVVRLSLGAGINFVALEKLKHLMMDVLPHASGQLGFLQAAAVGGCARALSAAAMSPVTLVKTRMEYGGPSHVSYRSTGHALAAIAAAEGPGGLFRGLVPTVLTNAPFSAIYYMLYTKLKSRLSAAAAEAGGGGVPAAAVNFVSGVAAATAATLLTQPSDVVRTRMQLGLPGTARGNALSTLGHVLKSSGPNALLAGAAPRVLKRTLQTALVWTLYEELVPRVTALVHLASAQAAADDEARQERERQRRGGGSRGGGG